MSTIIGDAARIRKVHMLKSAKSLSTLRKTLENDVISAAQKLLGMELVRGNLRARIVETEAYRAEGDPGSHAFRGKTPRNSIMFGKPGLAYVYFTYGNHWMLNVVAHEEGNAAAVLVRAAAPLSGLELMRRRRPKAKHDYDLLSGPGKLAAAFGITGKDYGVDLFDAHSSLHLEAGRPPTKILCGTRIGLTLGKGDELPWRFVDGHGLRFVSRPHPSQEI